MIYRVEYTEQTDRQLAEIEAYISQKASPQIATAFVDSIIEHCDGLAHFPKRGTVRDDLKGEIRLIGFRRRATIAFTVKDLTVIILGVFYGGQDIPAALEESDEDPNSP